MTTTPDAEKAKLRSRLEGRGTHRMYSYNVVQRVVDGRQGRRTARSTSCTDINQTPLLQRLSWTYAESANRVFARTQAVNHDAISVLQRDTSRLADLRAVIAGLEAELAATPAPDLAARAGGEEHLAEDAVRTRRLREAQAASAVVARRLASARAEAQDLRTACGQTAAMLQEQYDLVRAAERKLRAYTLRRAANYGRAWDAVRDEPVTPADLPVPHWADSADCVWLPIGFHDVVDPAPARAEIGAQP